MILLILGIAIGGLIIGALGRLVVPGPNPMSIFQTILVGVAGSFLGGLVGRLAFGWRYRYSFGFGLILAVLCTAVIVYLIGRRHPHRV